MAEYIDDLVIPMSERVHPRDLNLHDGDPMQVLYDGYTDIGATTDEKTYSFDGMRVLDHVLATRPA